MKSADKPSVIIIFGDNNKVSFSGDNSTKFAIVITISIIAIAVLTISLCCPELLADFVRFLIGKVINS